MQKRNLIAASAAALLLGAGLVSAHAADAADKKKAGPAYSSSQAPAANPFAKKT